MKTALIIGAGISGLLNARVLSETFDKVIILERDNLDDKREGVPQGNHIHTLLARGRQIIETLYPDLPQELKSRHIPIISWNSDIHIVAFNGIANKFETGISTLGISRRYLENIIRELTLKRSNISIQQLKVEDLIIENNRVTGLKTNISDVAGDLIIDASGRQSNLSTWLENAGYARPPISEVNPHMGYATRWYKIPESVELTVSSIVMQPRYKEALYRGAATLFTEDRKVVITLVGTNRDYPPTDDAGFLQFANSLPDSMITEWIQQLEPISPIYGYRASNQWRHYEKIALPENLLITGDGVCSFNPFYGQGMTVAAQEANMLRKLIQQDRSSLSQKFHKKQAAIIQLPWSMATIEDLRSPDVEGMTKQFFHSLAHRYMDNLQATATRDPYVARAFIQVFHLLKSPIILLHPYILWKMMSSTSD